MDFVKTLISVLSAGALGFVAVFGIAQNDLELEEMEKTEVEQTEEVETTEEADPEEESSENSEVDEEQEPNTSVAPKGPWKRLMVKPLPINSNVDLPQDI